MEPQTIDQNRHVLDRLLNPVRDVLTPEVAQAIAGLAPMPQPRRASRTSRSGTTRGISLPSSSPSTAHS